MATRQDVRNACVEEGLSIMIDVFDIIMDRDEATPDDIMRFIDDNVESVSVQTMYESFIVGGINRLSDYMAEFQGRTLP